MLRSSNCFRIASPLIRRPRATRLTDRTASRHRPLVLAFQALHNGAMRNADTVTASEMAVWVYSPESWRLDALGHESVYQAARDAGPKHYVRATAERTAGGAIAFGF